MNPIQKVLIDHWRCLGEITSDGVEGATKALIRKHPLRWGESLGWTLHLRRAIPMLEQTLIRAKRMFPHIDPDVHYSEQKHIFTFKSGYKIQFGHCLNRDDWIQYDSQQYDEIEYDELVQFEEQQYHNINTRLRSSDPILQRMLRVRSMSNPVRRQEGNINLEVNDPQWVRRRFVDPAPEGNKVLRKKMVVRDGPRKGETVFRDRIYLPATLYDNPDPEFVRQYEEELMDKPAHIQQAMLYGNWYVTAGSYFGEDWNQNIHVCHPFRIPDDWPQFRMMDWGFKTPGCVLWGALDYDDNLYIHRELTFKFKSATEVAKEVKAIERELDIWAGEHSGITGPADTQLWEERGSTGESKAEEFLKVGVPWLPADKKSRARNAQRILSRLRDHKQGTTTPGLVFFKNCHMCIKTIPGLQVDVHNPEEPIKGGDDHWGDALFYGGAFASHGRKGIPPRRKERDRSPFAPAKIVTPTVEQRRRFGYGM